MLKTKEIIFDTVLAQTKTEEVRDTKVAALPVVDSFPIGVNPDKEVITENPEVESYFQAYISKNPKKLSRVSWWQSHVTSKLAQFGWYQNLASPLSRILVVDSGERKEEVIDHLGDILRWDDAERAKFAEYVASSSPAVSEGKFFPGHYVVDKDASPEYVANLIIEQFNDHVASHYSDDIAAFVPLEDTLTIASLLEREAYDFDDMRYISGVIWNRLFAGMNLQLDATLQYAKANGNGTWWPPARPSDKFIKSPFNTYKNAGLPPSPIANPSLEAILAALNPKVTECMYYFHDKDGNFHCTKTYEEHIALLKQYYGKGK